MTLLVGSWSLAAFIFRIVPLGILANSFGFILYDIAALLPTSFLIMTLSFPPYSLLNKKILLSLIIETAIVVWVINTPGWIIENLILKGNEKILIWGPSYVVYVLHLVLLFSIGYLVLIRKFFKATGIEKQQVKYIVYGTIFPANLAMLTNLILPWFGIYQYYTWAGQVFMVFLVLFSGYAILKHHLFNLKVIATELLVFAIWLTFLMRIVTGKDVQNQLIDGGILFASIFLGIFLIKSVMKEVRQREHLEILTKELEAANDKLKELDRIKSQFLSFASHQVKSPMNVVKGFATLIYDGTYGPVSDKVRDTAEKIKESADRMISLVNNLLDMRKIEEGRMEFKLETADVGKLVGDVIEEHKTQATSKGLALTYDKPVDLFMANIDLQKFSQAIQNVVDNSIKYTQTGWIKVSIALTDGNQILITVADSGRGISADLLPKLFGQYARDSATASKIEGTGLGLYIAKQIIDGNLGQIWATSEGENKGSQFFIKIPRSFAQ
jgi:signal transduction histidine kinase